MSYLKVGLITIATGEAYREYAQNMFASAYEHVPEVQHIVFTDEPNFFRGGHVFQTNPKGFPNETLFRYHTMLEQADFLGGFDYLFYCDADMLWVGSPVFVLPERGLFATSHPGYVGKRGTPETRRESTAYCNNNREYFAGGFQGGRSEDYVNAMQTMAYNIDVDKLNGITAIWHDESHWNKYLAEIPPTMILPPSYCYPENYDGKYGWTAKDYPPILTCLTKPKAVRGDR